MALAKFPKIARPRIELPEAVSRLDWPVIDLRAVDVGKAMTGAVAAANVGHRAQRRRWPRAVGGVIVAGLAGWAILSNKALRSRLARGAGAIGARILAVRSNRYIRADIDRAGPIAFAAAETAPIEGAPFTEKTTIDATGYPAGLGSNNSDGIPIFEETGSPA